MAGSSQRIGRYLLIDEVRHYPPDPAVRTWRGYDEVLDREVFVRILHADDPRAPAFMGAARAAALVEDRRLLRVLDVLTIGSEHGEEAVVVSEWASGRTLLEAMADRHDEPLPPEDALTVVDEVARALSAGLGQRIAHGRLRPSSVLLTDAGEIRVRGLAVDAALWGVMPERASTKEQADVDALGGLLYFLCTAKWPGDTMPSAAPAPRVGRGDTVPPPSNIRAAVPRSIDDLVARSVLRAERPRNVANLPDAKAFATALGAARDYLAPTNATLPRSRRQKRRPMTARPVSATASGSRIGLRAIAALIAIAAVIGLGAYGWQLVVGGRSAWQQAPNPDSGAFLTALPSRPASAAPIEEGSLAILAARSYDPFGDDDGNGKPDRKKGREGEEGAVLAIDQDFSTAWLSDSYGTADLDGKGGVGLVLDLGQTRTVTGATLTLTGAGSSAQIRVADAIAKNPDDWTLLAEVPNIPGRIDIRASQPAEGRYVLVWFPTIGSTAEGSFQVGVQDIDLRGL